jgi:uncharacterized membrane protein
MLKKISLSVMVFTYITAGAEHFMKAGYFAALTAPFIPSPRVFVALTGTLYILLGFFLVFKKTRRAACYSIMLLLGMGLPINLYMFFSDTARGSVPQDVIVGRIPFSILLMLWAFWHSKEPKKQF